MSARAQLLASEGGGGEGGGEGGGSGGGEGGGGDQREHPSSSLPLKYVSQGGYGTAA